MRPLGPFMRAVLAAVVLLAALALVPWRQSRALEALANLDQLRRQASVAAAERVDLERNIQVLESRGRVVPLARDRLGMHTPSAAELVILPGDPNS
ncbi:MAG: cell division protein FtsL [Gemmatimonadetes bacterium]|nr:cell division protein FtsL [Gemmatimonadota bacterium]